MHSLACADRDARFRAHEKQRRFKSRSVLVFAVRVARARPARVNSLSTFSSTHVCSYPSLVLDFFSLEKVDFSASRFDFFQRTRGSRRRGIFFQTETHQHENFSYHFSSSGVSWTEEQHRSFLMGLNSLGKGDWRGISRHFVQTRTPTQVASHAQKYFIRQQNTQKRKRRASLFDIQQGHGDGATFVVQQMSGGSQNSGSDATIATAALAKVSKGSNNNATSSSLTKMLKNNGNTKGSQNDKLNSREEESMRTLADMVLTHDARQQKNDTTKQQRQQKQNDSAILQQQQQQQQHQRFLQEQKEYANGHPIAGQFYGAQSPPQTIPMTSPYYYNPMFAPPHAASPTEISMFPPMDPSQQQQNMNDWMAQMQRNSVAYQQQQQMAMASAMAAGIHPSMWTAQYNMLLSGQNPAVMGILRPSSQSAETQSTPETKEKIKVGGPNAARMRVSDSFTSYQGRDSPVDAAGIYRPVAGYPSRTEWLGATPLPQKSIPLPASTNAAVEP